MFDAFFFSKIENLKQYSTLLFLITIQIIKNYIGIMQKKVL